MSSRVDQIQNEAWMRRLLSGVFDEAVAARIALERTVEMGYVSRECAATAWKQERVKLVSRAALALSRTEVLNES